MIRLKRIVCWGLGLLLSATVCGAALLWVAGDEILLWTTHQVLEGTIDRDVHLDGTFSVDLGWEPGLAVTDVWIENPSWSAKKEMARIKRIEVQIALKPLFSGTLHLPRLVLEGMTVDLETTADGQVNWEFLEKDDDTESAKKKPKLPLLEFVSLRDVTLTHEDRRNGRTTDVFLAHLQKASAHTQDADGHASDDVQGHGSFNKTDFEIDGRFGPIEDALAAVDPFPMELSLKAVGLEADLKGTVENLPKAQGFDLDLTVTASSLSPILETLQSDLKIAGRAEASARLKGSLDTLAAQDLAVRLEDDSDRAFRAEGSIANLWTGQGLELDVSGTLGSQAIRLSEPPSDVLEDLLQGITRTDIDGRIIGTLRAPEIERFQARLDHASGADLSLTGQGSLDLSPSGWSLTKLAATGSLSLPDASVLEQAFDHELPDLGAIEAEADLSWAQGGLTLSSFSAKAKSYGGLRLGAKGRIGGHGTDNSGFEFDPRLDLSAALESTRPLAALLGTPVEVPADRLVLLIQKGLAALGKTPGSTDGLMGPRTRTAIEAYQAENGLSVDGKATPQLLRHLQANPRAAAASGAGTSERSIPRELLLLLGSAKASARLLRRAKGYGLDDLRVELGNKDTLRIDAAGSLQRLRFAEQDPLSGLALTVSIASPSSRILAPILPPEIPELSNLTGQFRVQGSLQALSVTEARFDVEGPDGLSGSATGEIAELTLTPTPAAKGLKAELSASAPGSSDVLQRFHLHLPELGPMSGRALLRNHGARLTLTEIDVAASEDGRTTARITGEIADLNALKEITLAGDFDLPTARLLAPEMGSANAALGRLRGQFGLSDTNGTLGLENLSAELANTDLASLSLSGLFRDFAHKDDLRFQAELEMPSVAALGRELGIEAGTLGAFSFSGQVSSRDNRFQADGQAQLGQTQLAGTFSGRFVDGRPILGGKLESPRLHLADFGLVPKTDEAETPENRQAREEKAQKRRRSADTPIPFDALRAFDLDLEVRLEHVEGVEIDIDTLDGRVRLVGGELKADPVLVNFVGGHVTARLFADTRGASPQVNLSLEADNVHLGKLLSQVKVDVPLDGILDMVMNLNAEGDSRSALTSTLQGEVGLAISRGQIRSSLLDLAAEDFTTWLFAQSTRAGYSDLNCFIARFNLSKGVARSDQLLLDTTNVLAVGEGKIDLRDQTVNIKVEPQSKKDHLIELTSPFKIKGPLANPSVTVSTTRTATRVVGEVVLSPVRLLGSLLPFVGDGGGDKNPCLNLVASADR